MTLLPIPRLRQLVLRVLVCAAAALGAVAALPVAAQAHPSLLFTTPAAETADPAPPSSIVLVFGEPVTVAAHAVTLTNATGHNVEVGAPALVKDGHTVTAAIGQDLAAGVYTVTWRATGSDGDLVEGRFRFAVGATITAPSTMDTGAEGGSWPVTVFRFVLLAGLALTTGGPIIGPGKRR